LKPTAAVPAGAPRVTPGIQVQPYRQPLPVAPLGFWGKVRRVLFGAAEREAGA
jgi:hypothetical protein